MQTHVSNCLTWLEASTGVQTRSQICHLKTNKTVYNTDNEAKRWISWNKKKSKRLSQRLLLQKKKKNVHTLYVSIIFNSNPIIRITFFGHRPWKNCSQNKLPSSSTHSYKQTITHPFVIFKINTNNSFTFFTWSQEI